MKRGRVAVTPPILHARADELVVDPVARTMVRSMNDRRPPGTIHVGHARTLLLGKLACDQLGIDFHVRIDGNPHDKYYLLTAGLFELMQCILFLDLKPARIYWSPSELQPDPYYAERLGANEWEKVKSIISMWGKAPHTFCHLLDDLVDNHPSVLLRGHDFLQPNLYGVSTESGRAMADYLMHETAIYDAAGRKREQISFPLIVKRSGSKFSKSAGAVPWDLLTSVSPEFARSFLLGTAMFPESPRPVSVEEFDLASLSEQSYVWDWGIWGEFARNQ